MTALMRASNRGDKSAYHRLLHELTPALRGLARRAFTQYGLNAADVEDLVQETLLALHLKRHTWDESKPLLPWVQAIARNKLIDDLRRSYRRKHLHIDDVSASLADKGQSEGTNALDIDTAIGKLNGRDRDIVVAISIEGASARQVGERLGMSEGAVRVTLHRALRSLAKAFGS